MTWAPDYEDKNSSKSLPRNLRLKTFRDSLTLGERYPFSLVRVREAKENREKKCRENSWGCNPWCQMTNMWAREQAI